MLLDADCVYMIYTDVDSMDYTVISEKQPFCWCVVHTPSLPGRVSQGQALEKALSGICSSRHDIKKIFETTFLAPVWSSLALARLLLAELWTELI